MGPATGPGFIGTESNTRRLIGVVSCDLREASFADSLCEVWVMLGDLPELVAAKTGAFTASQGQRPGGRQTGTQGCLPTARVLQRQLMLTAG